MEAFRRRAGEGARAPRKPGAVDVVHGGVTREERRKVVERFMQDRDMLVLIANDAAGEGLKLHRGHFMVNYDLPWNPNKIEQRFGRIHRIGQTEVCHLWNLVAADTREGEVYARLLEKLKAAREAIGGRVYDVLGELFEGTALRDLLVEAIQYGEQEDVKARLFRAVDGAVDQQHLLQLLERRALTNDSMPAARVHELRIEMERVEAQRLQPHHIQSFLVEASKQLGGQIKRREEDAPETTRKPVPGSPALSPKEQTPTRFQGTVMISPERPERDIHQIVEAIIEQLTTLPEADVSIRLEIDAEVQSGLDRTKVRTLIENPTTLGFIEKLVR